MPMVSFHSRFPEIASRELRRVQVLDEGEGVPAGDYLFTELFCDDPNCNCSRVVFIVYDHEDHSRILATLNFGWESAEFYTNWLHGDAETGAEMAKVTLEPFGEQSEYAEDFRSLAEDVLLADADYIERLKRHHAQFRASLPPAKPRLGGPRGSNYTPPRKKKKR